MGLYLETGAIPMRFILSSRRLLYHNNILKRENEELVKRIYREQLKNPLKGDFVELLKADFNMFNIVQNDEEIRNMKTSTYKNFIRKCTKSAAFEYLTTKQTSHIKIKTIKYTQLETQKYLLSPIFSNEDINQLYALRSGTTNCKANFK